jgi:hypothetical protein
MKTPTIPSSVPGRIPDGPPPEDPRSLLACFLTIVADWEAIFPQSRTYLRAVRQALGALICLGRRTLSRIIWTNGGQHRDWRAEYFLFSRLQWHPAQLFTPIVHSAHSTGVPAATLASRSMTRACAKPAHGFNRLSFSAIRSHPSFTSI